MSVGTIIVHSSGGGLHYLAPACLIRDGAVGRRVKFSITCPTSHDRRPTTAFACFRRETVWNGLPEKLRDDLQASWSMRITCPSMRRCTHVHTMSRPRGSSELARKSNPFSLYLFAWGAKDLTDNKGPPFPVKMGKNA